MVGGNGVGVANGVDVGASVEPGWVGVKVCGTAGKAEVGVRCAGGVVFSANARERLPTTSMMETNP